MHNGASTFPETLPNSFCNPTFTSIALSYFSVIGLFDLQRDANFHGRTSKPWILYNMSKEANLFLKNWQFGPINYRPSPWSCSSTGSNIFRCSLDVLPKTNVLSSILVQLDNRVPKWSIRFSFEGILVLMPTPWPKTFILSLCLKYCNILKFFIGCHL